MGTCGSKPQNITVWESFFNKSTLDSMKLQYDQCVETVSCLQLEDGRKQCEKYQEEFNSKNSNLARSIFRLYDHDKDGLQNLQQFERLVQDSISVLHEHCKSSYQDICVKSGAYIYDQQNKRACAQRQQLSGEVQDIITRRMNVIISEIDHNLETHLNNMKSNIHHYAVCILTRQSVDRKHIEVEEFVNGFFTAYSVILDPMLSYLHVYDNTFINNTLNMNGLVPMKRNPNNASNISSNPNQSNNDVAVYDICVNIDNISSEDSDDDMHIPKTPVVTRGLRQGEKHDIDLVVLPSPEPMPHPIEDKPPRKSISQVGTNNNRPANRKKKVIANHSPSSLSNNNTK